MAGGGGGGDLEYQPTWAVAIVCTTIIICFSLAVERILHYAGKVLKKIVNYSFRKKEGKKEGVEKIVNYNFKNKALLEMALTHPSYRQAPSYERLEFFGDAALGLAVAKYSYEAYPEYDQHQLTSFRKAIVNTEMLARVAFHHDLFTHLRHNCPSLALNVKEFARVVSEEGDDIRHGYAPKVLADVVESILAALYIDSDYDLNKLWDCFSDLLRPLSAKTLREFQRIEGNSINELTADEIDRAKQKLNELCFKKRWRPPSYSKEVHGPAHERRFICSVNIDTKEGPYAAFGDVKLNLKDAENSAASKMLCHLRTLRSQQRRFLE